MASVRAPPHLLTNAFIHTPQITHVNWDIMSPTIAFIHTPPGQTGHSKSHIAFHVYATDSVVEGENVGRSGGGTCLSVC